MSSLKPIRMFREGEIPVFPKISQRLLSLYESGASFIDFEHIINTDIGLALRLIRFANSAFYKTGNATISTLLPAIQKLGQTKVLEIVTTAQLCNDFPGVKAINMAEFWRQSLFTAVLAKNILLAVNETATSKNAIITFLKKTLQGSNNTTPSEAYQLGLFSNIGFIMSLFLIPEGTNLVLAKGVVENTENDIYKMSHACLFFWGFDEKYSEPMYYINSPLASPLCHRQSALILNVALTLRAHYIPGALVPLANQHFLTIIENLSLDIETCDDLAALTLAEVDSLTAYLTNF